MVSVSVSSATIAHQRQMVLIARIEATAARLWYKTLRELASATSEAYLEGGEAGTKETLAKFTPVAAVELEVTWRASMTPLARATYGTMKPAKKARAFTTLERKADKPLTAGQFGPGDAANVPAWQTLVDQEIKQWNRRFGALKVRSITTTQADIVQRILTESALEGWSIPQTAARIHAGMLDRSKFDAMRIARTEVHGAAMAGVDAGARATGLTYTKQWIAAIDARTRPDHSAADGQEVGKDGHFTVGGESLLYPGDPSGGPHNVVNCRCSYLTNPT